MATQTDQQVVPISGMNIYDYSQSNLRTVCQTPIRWGLLFTSFCIFACFTILFKSAKVSSPIVYVLLAVFLGIGLAMLIWGARLYMTSTRSLLELYPDGFIWRDSLGRSGNRIRYDRVLRCAVSVWNKPYFSTRRYSNLSPTHFKMVVATTAGSFTFHDDISSWSKLRDFFLSIQTAPADEGVFRYWDARNFSIGAVLLPFCGFFAVDLVDSYRRGQIVYINHRPEPMPFWFLGLFTVVIGIFFVFGANLLLQSLFEKIVVTKGRVVSCNLFGWPTVKARLDQVEHGSFKKGSSGVRSVQTVRGEISWGWGISNYSTLNAIMQKASDESMLGREQTESVL